MTKRQQRTRNQTTPRQTSDQRRAMRADKALKELERAGFVVQRLGNWQFYIAPTPPKARDMEVGVAITG